MSFKNHSQQLLYTGTLNVRYTSLAWNEIVIIFSEEEL